MVTEADVLVIGAGPAGATAAARLVGAGFDVCVVERQRFPRFMIGESLLPHCVERLREAGLLERVEAQGFMVKHGALFVRGEEAFDLDFDEQFTATGARYAWQVPRADFDAALADGAAARGARVLYEQQVTSVEVADGDCRLEARGADGTTRTLRGRFVLDATGSAGLVSKALGLERPSDMPERMAYFTHAADGERPGGRDEGKIWIVTVDDDVWMWIIPFHGGRASIGVVGEPARLDALGPDPEARLRAAVASSPRVQARLGGAPFLFPPRALRGYASNVERLSGPGFALIGNAAGFLDPVFSSGVTLGLESAALAVALVARRLRGEAVDWAAEYDAPMRGGFEVFRAFVDGWYDGALPSIIYAGRVEPDLKRQITSVLSGYVWDAANPFVRRPERLWTLARHLRP